MSPVPRQVLYFLIFFASLRRPFSFIHAALVFCFARHGILQHSLSRSPCAACACLTWVGAGVELCNPVPSPHHLLAEQDVNHAVHTDVDAAAQGPGPAWRKMDLRNASATFERSGKGGGVGGGGRVGVCVDGNRLRIPWVDSAASAMEAGLFRLIVDTGYLTTGAVLVSAEWQAAGGGPSSEPLREAQAWITEWEIWQASAAEAANYNSGHAKVGVEAEDGVRADLPAGAQKQFGAVCHEQLQSSAAEAKEEEAEGAKEKEGGEGGEGDEQSRLSGEGETVVLEVAWRQPTRVSWSGRDVRGEGAPAPPRQRSAREWEPDGPTLEWGGGEGKAGVDGLSAAVIETAETDVDGGTPHVVSGCEMEPWWEVDLGADRDMARVDVWAAMRAGAADAYPQSSLADCPAPLRVDIYGADGQVVVQVWVWCCCGCSFATVVSSCFRLDGLRRRCMAACCILSRVCFIHTPSRPAMAWVGCPLLLNLCCPANFISSAATIRPPC